MPPPLRRAEQVGAGGTRRWAMALGLAAAALVGAVALALRATPEPPAWQPAPRTDDPQPAAQLQPRAQAVVPTIHPGAAAAAAEKPLATQAEGARGAQLAAVAHPGREVAVDEAGDPGSLDEPDDPRPATIPSSPSDGMARADVLAGLGPVRALMERCVEQQPGQGTVRMTISSAGRVVAATVTGPFAGTRVGDCIAAAARTGVFHGSRRDQTTLAYPFTLRRER